MGGIDCCLRVGMEDGQIVVRNLDDDHGYERRSEQPRFVGDGGTATRFLGSLAAGVGGELVKGLHIEWVDEDEAGAASGCRVTGDLVMPPGASLDLSSQDVQQVRDGVQKFGASELIGAVTSGVTVTLAPVAYAYNYRDNVPVSLDPAAVSA